MNDFPGFPSMILMEKNSEGNLVIHSIYVGVDGITTVLEKIGGLPDKILGCTDSNAYNYNAEAIEDDGTCEFNFKPRTKVALKAAVNEWIANSTDANSTYGHINTWDTSLITDMSQLFYNTKFNDDISGWDTSSVTNMYGMFSNSDFNQDISDCDVSSVTDMSRMFFDADSFNQDISDWDVSSVTDMDRMFYSADSFNQDISGWDVSSVTDMSWMFTYADNFNHDISNSDD